MQPQIESRLQDIKKEKDIILKAKAIKALILDKQVRVVEIAKYLDTQSSYISNILRLLELPDLAIDGYYSKILTITHLIILSRLPQEEIIPAYERILSESLTVAQTEDLVREKLYSFKTKGEKIDSTTTKELLESFQTLGEDVKVSIVQTQIKGKITIQVKGNRQKTSEFFEKLLQKVR